MEKQLVVKNTIVINASAAKVWDVLTNRRETKKYMFGCEVVSDWKIGSPFLWRGIFDGKEMVVVKGSLVAMDKDKYLAYTTIDPNSSIPDIPENYTTVTYAIKAENGTSELTVTQGDFAKVAEGEKRFGDVNAAGGWQHILEQIKSIAEGK